MRDEDSDSKGNNGMGLYDKPPYQPPHTQRIMGCVFMVTAPPPHTHTKKSSQDFSNYSEELEE